MRDRHLTNRNKLLIGAAGIGAAGLAFGVAVGAGVIMGARRVVRFIGTTDLRDKRVLITGGSRGLGLALAEEFAREGCLIAICARDAEEVESAVNHLRQSGAQVLGTQCDITKEEEVTRMIDEVRREYGRIDVLVNNAGVMEVGPLGSHTIGDFHHAMDVMFWGMLHTTLAVIPEMQRRHEGRIANITSIGGKISVPHLVPYSSAKFAAVGFSEGIAAELASSGIKVTTVVPGLMRTGSHVNAHFKGNHRAEYRWFSLSAANPITAVDARRAARRIVRAVRRGEAETIIGLRAKALVLTHGVAPGATVRALSLVNRVLPDDTNSVRHTGHESASAISESPLTKFGRSAGKRLNQYRATQSPRIAQA